MVIRAPISHVIGARSRGCPITAIQLQLSVLDTCNWTPTLRARQLGALKWLFFAVFLPLSQNDRKYSRRFEYKIVHIDFLISNFVIDAIN